MSKEDHVAQVVDKWISRRLGGRAVADSRDGHFAFLLDVGGRVFTVRVLASDYGILFLTFFDGISAEEGERPVTEINAAMAVINDALPYGSFEYSETANMYCFRISTFPVNGEISDDALDKCAATVETAVKDYSTRLLAVADGLITASQVVERMQDQK